MRFSLPKETLLSTKSLFKETLFLLLETLFFYRQKKTRV